MKILAAGDIHGDSLLVKKLAKKAEKENVELVILCGDLTSDEKVEGIIGPFLKVNKKVLLVPGNHESIATADFLAELYGVKNIHGYSVKYKDIGFFGCSASNIGINQLTEKEIFDLLKTGFDHIKSLKRRVMITHTPPSGTKMEKFSKKFLGNENLVVASQGVEKAIKEFKPDILLCSHLHEAEGIEEKIGNTRVINVGKEGKVIDI